MESDRALGYRQGWMAGIHAIREMAQIAEMTVAEAYREALNHYWTRLARRRIIDDCPMVGDERRPPTLRQAGDAMASLLSKATQTGHWDSPEVHNILMAWREAVEREEP